MSDLDSAGNKNAKEIFGTSGAALAGIYTLSPSLRAVITFFADSAAVSGNRDGFTNLQLQVLLYYAQGFHLGKAYSPIFPENIEAWPQGPVVRPAWTVFQESRVLPTNELRSLGVGLSNNYQTVLLQWIYSRLGRLDSKSLAQKASQERPYLDSYVPGRGKIIPQHLMRKYFETARL